jgi:hypothetical protein
MRLNERVAELDERRLAFSAGESVELLRTLGVPLGGEVLDLHRRSEGWPAGLRLLAADDGGNGLPASLAEYLEEEVLRAQPDGVREFLLRSAVLERFDGDLAARVSGRDDAPGFVERLAAARLFLVREKDGFWRYQRLFHEFLRHRLAERPAMERADLHLRAARAWRERGDCAAAGGHNLQGGDMPSAAAAIDRIAESMVAGGRLDVLAGWLDQLPAELRATRPGLAVATAWVTLRDGSAPEAATALAPAIDHLIRSGAHTRALCALVQLMGALELAGRHGAALETGRFYLERLDPRTPLLAAVRCRLEALAAYLGRGEDDQGAEPWPSAAGGGARGAVLEAYRAISAAVLVERPQGAVAAALGGLDAAIATLELHPDEDVLTYLPWARLQRAVLLEELGRPEDVLDECQLVADAAKRAGIAGLMVATVAALQTGALADLERWRQCEALLPRDADLPDVDDRVVEHRHLLTRARLAAQAGDGPAARGWLAAAAERLRRSLPGRVRPRDDGRRRRRRRARRGVRTRGP